MKITISCFIACKQEEEKVIVKTEAKVEKSTKQLKEELTSKGFQIFDYVDE